MSNLNEISSNSDEARRNSEQIEETELDYSPMGKVSIIGKAMDFFGIETNIGGAAESVWDNVIKPTFLDGCRDAMYALADYFFGGGGGSRRRSENSNDQTPYSKKFKGNKSSKGKAPNQVAYYITSPDRTYILDKLNEMWDVVNQCDFCSVQDMLTIFKKSSSNYTLGDWGWFAKDLAGVRAVRNSEGEFYLNLPKPKPKED